MKERVIITGANGQLGKEMAEALSKEQYEVYPFDKMALDITNMAQVDLVMNRIKPHIVIHCAAYTRVDEAEEECGMAYIVNAVGARNVAVISEEVGAKFVYISTDYVFSGDKECGYHEFDTPNPMSVYGASKYAGEQLVQSLQRRYFIVRTSWLYGKYGNNFVKTMLNLGKRKEELSIVSDQIGSPTYVTDLISVIKKLITTSLYGTYHVSNSGACSWYEFAQKIFSYSNLRVNVLPISTEQFGAKAPRPKYSILQHKMLHWNGFTKMPSWEEGLERFFIEIKNH